MEPLILYATSDCHLCEAAQRVIYQALHVPVRTIDIADDCKLLTAYSLRIPVLRRIDTGAEIDWPFGVEDVRCLCQPPALPATASEDCCKSI
jgi:hypothetical protein